MKRLIRCSTREELLRRLVDDEMLTDSEVDDFLKVNWNNVSAEDAAMLVNSGSLGNPRTIESIEYWNEAIDMPNKDYDSGYAVTYKNGKIKQFGHESGSDYLQHCATI